MFIYNIILKELIKNIIDKGENFNGRREKNKYK